MMAKLPADRYQSAADVQQALRAWLESEAAFGRVAPPASLAAGRTRPGSRPRGEVGSGADLVSGSGSDLRNPGDTASDARHVFSPLHDTDPNLVRGTVKIPKHLAKASSDIERPPRGSDVLSPGGGRSHDSVLGPPLPAPPPVVAPPLSIDRPFVGPSLYDAPVERAGPIELPFGSAVPRLGATRTSSWPWIVLVTAAILCALILALLAF